jgi:hypothetical protein
MSKTINDCIDNAIHANDSRSKLARELKQLIRDEVIGEIESWNSYKPGKTSDNIKEFYLARDILRDEQRKRLEEL